MPPTGTPAQMAADSPNTMGAAGSVKPRKPMKQGSGTQKQVKLDRVPTGKPPFTIGDIRRAIPKHCFQRSYLKSFGHLAFDLAVVGSMFYIALFIDPTFTDARLGPRMGPFVRHVLWMVYWAITGCYMTGLWVIGHECGHGGFSDSEFVNDIVGLVVHSCLLVPYFSWKTSHRRHHSNTNNLARDEVFVPVAENANSPNFGKNDHEEPNFVVAIINSLKRSFHIVIMLTLGWPLYLSLNTTSHDYGKRSVPPNHFLPTSPIFTTDRERREVLISDITLLVVLYTLYLWAGQLGGFVMFFYVFGVPLMITNLFLVLITFLQHTDMAVPHYTGSEWDWLRGALATVDRNYGPFNVLNNVFHHINDTHVVHHLFSDMPFYNAQEATKAVKPLLGPYYRFDNTPIVKALWNSFEFLEVGPDHPSDKSGVLWFHHGK